jgi:hypothetical protein
MGADPVLSTHGRGRLIGYSAIERYYIRKGPFSLVM